MAAVHSLSESLSCPSLLNRALSPFFVSRSRFSSAATRRPCALPRDADLPIIGGNGALDGRRAKSGSRVQDAVQLKEDWLVSLSCPFPTSVRSPLAEGIDAGVGPEVSGWVIGIDPDTSGALALLKPESSGFSAQVFDAPYLQVPVGKKVRKRLDTRSIVQLLQSFGAPLGTTAYIEQSLPFPQDGKQGWWSGGFTYGLWIGILVSSGFSVVPVSSRLWKGQLELSGSSLTKDDSRKAASVMFPYLSSSLKRKKDHGRAEALLIAAYGKDLKM